MIDLDKIDNTGTPKPTGDAEIVLRGGAVKRSRTTLEDTYDRHTKKIYVIDKSASMDSGLIGMETVDQYQFTPALLKRFRERIANAEARFSNLFAGPVAADPDADEDTTGSVSVPYVIADEDLGNDPLWVTLGKANDELLKAEVVARGLTVEMGLYKNTHGYSYSHNKFSKMAGVKKYAAEMIDERMTKFPDADTHLIAFDGGVYYRKPTGRDDLLAQIEALQPDGGNTLIGKAIAEGMKLCEDNPSMVGVHHIILVSDALDSTAPAEVKPFVEVMKSKNIVLDFIHVLSINELVYGEAAWQSLKEYCEATGGTYTRVDRVAAFKEKLFDASRKVLLLAPPPPAQLGGAK